MPNGPGDVLDLVRRGVASTRADILDATGLSRMTVASRVDTLLHAGLLVEGSPQAGGGGRRPRALQLNVAHAHVLVATVNTTHVRTGVTDLAGRLLADDHIDVALASGPERTLEAIEQSGRGLLTRTGLDVGGLCGVGISVPGPVDPGSGRPSQPPMMPGWDAYPVAEHVAPAFPGVPVLTANDADAAALGEQALGHPEAPALCLVKVDTGIGCGIVIGGQTYRGVDGGAGDIGHVRLADRADAVCQCGSRGCLAAVASGRAVARELTALGVPASSGRDVGRLLAAGNVDAARLTQQAGRRIGEVTATLVSLLNPGVVLIGGALASAPLLAGIRETLYRLALPRATRHLTLQLGSLGDDAAIVGLSRLVVDQEYAAAAINARLG
jgi:predicted NBD/HSP70 family sugar kinase